MLPTLQRFSQENSGRQVYFLRRRFSERKVGAGSNKNLGVSKIKLS